MTKQICKGPECDHEAIAVGLCGSHYRQQSLGKPLTPVTRYNKKPVAPEGYEFCNECKTFKPVEAFYLTENGKPRYRCKACQAEYNKKYQARRKEAA